MRAGSKEKTESGRDRHTADSQKGRRMKERWGNEIEGRGHRDCRVTETDRKKDERKKNERRMGERNRGKRAQRLSSH